MPSQARAPPRCCQGKEKLQAAGLFHPGVFRGRCAAGTLPVWGQRDKAVFRLEPQGVKSIITNSAGERGPVRGRGRRSYRLSLGAGGGGGGCLGRKLTVKVYGAVPVEVHVSEHLIQLRIHQRLPQQGWCCLSQLRHSDPSIPVPVKLGSQQGSAPPTQSHLHLSICCPWMPSCPPAPGSLPGWIPSPRAGVSQTFSNPSLVPPSAGPCASRG